MTPKTHTIDDVTKAQEQVIRFVENYLREHPRPRSERKTTQRKHMFYGSRRLMAALRREFDCWSRRCNVCLKWKRKEDFNRHPKGIAGLQPRCKECMFIVRKYGRTRDVPQHVLRELREDAAKYTGERATIEPSAHPVGKKPAWRCADNGS